MKKWKIPVHWEMSGYMEIESNTLNEAIETAKTDGDLPLPDGDYVDGSFGVSDKPIDEIRAFDNNGQEDDVPYGTPTGMPKGEHLSNDAFNGLNKIASATKMDCWFMLIEDEGTDYIYDLENGEPMDFDVGIAQFAEGIVDPLDCEAYRLTPHERVEVYNVLCNYGIEGVRFHG